MSNNQRIPVFCYHPNTGEYTGIDYADPDPEQPGNWIMPEHSTIIEPPLGNGVPQWNGESWQTTGHDTVWKYLDRNNRDIRNHLLKQSDWTQLPDAPLTTDDVTAWRLYRHILRNLPQTAAWPFIEFPETPGKGGVPC